MDHGSMELGACIRGTFMIHDTRSRIHHPSSMKTPPITIMDHGSMELGACIRGTFMVHDTRSRLPSSIVHENASNYNHGSWKPGTWIM